ncbi:MAG: sugar kinase [Clostridia bacterium]|nr:sugar kinase [Clostridia bacterium]
MIDLTPIDNARIGILGDFALDIYWYADMTKSELSRETPHYPLPVVEERIYPGAAGNVAANVCALKPARCAVCGVAGDDWRGGLLRSALERLGADCAGLIIEPGRTTNAYCKPMRMGLSDVVYEDPRIDFSGTSPITAETEAAILAWLDAREGELDMLCVCDQFGFGAITEAVIERLANYAVPVIVDSRNRCHHYRNVTIKPNEHECARALEALGLTPSADDGANAASLEKASGSRVLLTLGERGSLYDGRIVPAVKYDGPVDICGAGDSFLSAFACCTAAGLSAADAQQIATCASGVTVRKLGVTGTASREEIGGVYGKYSRPRS